MEFKINFINSAFIELLDRNLGHYYVQFIDRDTGKLLHDGVITNNMWIKCNHAYFINYKIRILRRGTIEIIKEFDFDATNKRVYIAFDSKSLGDNLGWVPFVEEFRSKHKCQVICSTFFNKLFQSTYPNIQFVPPGTTVHNLYAMYTIGCFNDEYKNKVPWNTLNNQEIASNILGLEFKEIKPKVFIAKQSRPIKEPYICVSPTSTAGCKLWNYPGGWQIITNYLTKLNYKIVVLGQNDEYIKHDLNIIYPNTQDISSLIQWTNHCEFFVGLCSGGSWLAWALNKKVVMIGGFSNEYTEFYTPYRVINKNVCYGCWNDENYKFDPSDWNWCPKLKGTDRQFECSTRILPEDVISMISKLLV